MNNITQHNQEMFDAGKALLEKGHRIRIKFSLDHSGNFRDPVCENSLKACISTANKKCKKVSVYYDLRVLEGDKRQMVCVDFDKGVLWGAVKKSLNTHENGQFIMNPSPRGGHVIGYAPGKPGAYQKGTRIPLQSLATADFLTENVCLLGKEGRSISWCPSADDMGTIPLALMPHPKRKIPSVIVDNVVVEGTRDNTMFRIAKSAALSTEERAEVLKFTNKTFFQPPLDDEVITKFVNQEPDSNDPGNMGDRGGVKASNKIVVAQLKNDRFALETGLDGMYRYHPGHRQWYEYTGTHWVGISESQLLVIALSLVDNNIEEYLCNYTVEKRKGLVKNLLGDLEGTLAFSDKQLSIRHFTSWNNGLFDFKEQTLVDHTPEVFVRHCIDKDYSRDEGLSVISQKFLIEITHGNPLYLMAIRLLFHNAFRQPDDIQIISLFYGAHGVGKSVIANFLSSYFGKASLSVNISNCSSAFAKHSLTQASLLVINELTGLTSKECQSLKSMVGHDQINTEVKFKQGISSAQVNGVWIATSNEEPDDIAGSDIALRDRLLTIECFPRVGGGDSHLILKLQNNMSGWMNWSLNFHPDVLRLTVRAGAFNTLLSGYKDPLVIFISRCVKVDPNSFVWCRDLTCRYKDFNLRQGLAVIPNSSTIKQSLVKVLRSLYLLQVPEGRRFDPTTSSKIGCIFGIALVNEEGVDSMGFPKNPHEELFKQQSLFDVEKQIFPRILALKSPDAEWVPENGGPLPQGARIWPVDMLAKPPLKQGGQPLSLLKPLLGAGLEMGLQRDRNSEEHKLLDLEPAAGANFSGASPSGGSVQNLKEQQQHNAQSSIGGDPILLDEVLGDSFPQFRDTVDPPSGFPVSYPLGRLGVKRLTSAQRIKEKIPTVAEVIAASSVTPLEAYAVAQVNKAYGLCYSFFRDHIGRPLASIPRVYLSEYSPHAPNGLAGIMGQRIDAMRKIGVIANILESSLEGTGKIWACTLGETRRQHPNNSNINQDKKDGGSIFPYEYRFDVDGCHRYLGHPSHTVAMVWKPWKNNMIRVLGDLTGLNFFDIDMGACHARAILVLREKKDRRILTDACENENTWLDLARAFLVNFPKFAPLGLLRVRKCIKVYCLAQLNGGGTNSTKHFDNTLTDIVCAEGKTGESYKSSFALALSTQDYVVEFHGHGVWMYEQRHVYSLYKAGKVFPRINKNKKGPNKEPIAKGTHTLASIVLCGMETYMLSLVVEYLGTISTKVVPIALVHDGMIVMTEKTTNTQKMQAIIDGFKPFSIRHFGHDLGLELTPFND